MIVFVKKPKKAQSGNKLRDTAYLEAVNDALAESDAFDQDIINNAPGYENYKSRSEYADKAALSNPSAYVKSSDVQKYVPWADPEKVKKLMSEYSSDFGQNLKGTLETDTSNPAIGYRSILKNPGNITSYYNQGEDKPYKQEMTMYEPEGGFYETLDVTDTPTEKYQDSGKTDPINYTIGIEEDKALDNVSKPAKPTIESPPPPIQLGVESMNNIQPSFDLPAAPAEPTSPTGTNPMGGIGTDTFNSKLQRIEGLGNQLPADINIGDEVPLVDATTEDTEDTVDTETGIPGIYEEMGYRNSNPMAPTENVAPYDISATKLVSRKERRQERRAERKERRQERRAERKQKRVDRRARRQERRARRRAKRKGF